MVQCTFHVGDSSGVGDWKRLASLLIVSDAAHYGALLKALPSDLSQLLERAASRSEFKPKAGKGFSATSAEGARVSLALLPAKSHTFGLLEWGRKYSKAFDRKKEAGLYLASPRAAIATDALLSALLVQRYELPAFKKRPKKDKSETQKISLYVAASEKEAVRQAVAEAEAQAEGTNLVRRLAVLPGNYLSPSLYRKEATALAKERGLKVEWISLAELKKRGAGAFEAVAKGAHDPESGILKVSLETKGAKSRIALVGKGLCFDTGGFNLKTGQYMYGMNDDMTGSAVVLSLLFTLQRLKLPVSATAYLAITENMLSPQAYRPNDVITSLSGKTIEIVDTDAEGRMVLADTLTIAGEEKPSLIVDFATLTGACIRAIGTLYSGAYSNRRAFFALIRKAGELSGERVWPFPNDPDFGRCLKSEVADIKQCRPTGGVDHIEAGFFLSQFLPKGIPWIHIDLSACGNEGGLAHVASKTTGFGVRFGVQLVRLFTQCSK